jgi:hypothetical protein
MSPSKTKDDRRRELRALVQALREVRGLARENGQFDAFLSSLDDCTRKAEHLLGSGASQADLNDLSREVPMLIYCHPHWTPPLEMQADGTWEVPAWFRALEPAHERMIAAAIELRVVGSY